MFHIPLANYEVVSVGVGAIGSVSLAGIGVILRLISILLRRSKNVQTRSGFKNKEKQR